jgi:hypothetical protein
VIVPDDVRRPASAVLSVNATPVLVDIDSESPASTSRSDSRDHTSTRAIVAVHVTVRRPTRRPPISSSAWPGLIETAPMHTARSARPCVGSWVTFGVFDAALEADDGRRGWRAHLHDEELRDERGRTRLRAAKGEWFYHHPTHGSNLRMTEWWARCSRHSSIASRSRTAPGTNATA